MYRQSLATIVFLLALPTLSAFQTATTLDSPPDKADVLKLMEIAGAKAYAIQSMEGVAQQARTKAEQAFKQKIPDATPMQLAKVDALADSVFKSLPIDEVLDAMVPAYQKHLTKSDLEAILSFYSSPVGQKLIKEMPAIMKESVQAGGEVGHGRMGAMAERLNQQVLLLATDEQQKQPSGQSQTPIH